MKKQRAMSQMKEQDKTPETQRNEVEIGNLPEEEFRIMIVKMIQDLAKRMEAKIKKMQEGLPWWRSGWESACQCRGHGFEPWSGRIPHAAERLSPCTTTEIGRAHV